MWRNTYKDYAPDDDWIQERVEPGRGIIGCEMHEINGWQEMQHKIKVVHEHPWTYKIVLEYHACKKCGYIIESRNDYEEREGELYKELACPRCHTTFIAKKPGPKTPY